MSHCFGEVQKITSYTLNIGSSETCWNSYKLKYILLFSFVFWVLQHYYITVNTLNILFIQSNIFNAIELVQDI